MASVPADSKVASPGASAGTLETLVVSVPAMDCPEEVSLIERAWERLEGVREVRTNLLERTATVIIDPLITPPPTLLAALAKVGLKAEFISPGAPPVVQYYLPSYDQPETVPAITKALQQEPSVKEIAFNDVERVVKITYDPRFLTVPGVQQILQSTGVVFQHIAEGTPKPLRQLTEAPEDSRAGSYPGGMTSSGDPPSGIFVAPPVDVPVDAPHSLAADARLIGILFGTVLWGIGALLMLFPAAALFGKIILFITAVLMGWKTLKRAVRSALDRHLDMHVLMVAASIGAMFLGAWEEAAMLMVLFSFAQWVEGWNIDRARSAVRSFQRRQPSRVRIQVDGTWDQVPIERVQIGMIAEVRPGELIPLDGRVAGGSAAVDESSLTGEATPTHKQEGSPLFAGTSCLNGVLQYTVTKSPQHSTIQRMQEMVLEAQSTRAPMQSVVDDFAKRYTPIVLGLAVLLALLPPIIELLITVPVTPEAQMAVWHKWIYRSLSLLVLACPCALVISTPVAFVAALGHAARQGILIKGGHILEAVGSLRALAFDKTGTLTSGHLELIRLEGYGVSEEAALQLALTLEQSANHPVALAILRTARHHNVAPLTTLSGFRQHGGKGVEGWLGKHHVFLGSLPWLLDERGLLLQESHRQRLEEAASWNATLVGLQADQELIGLFAFRDPIRPETAGTLATLRTLGIERIEMLTGDNPKVAGAIAGEAGVDAFHANLLPEDKPMKVRALQQAYHQVGMIGDGMNDAPALANATVGIAMGERGVDVALQSADIVLLGDDLTRIPELIQLSRRTLAIIRQNIAIAIGIKALFAIVLALGGLGLWAAVLGDMGGSLAVTANSLRLLSKPPKSS